MSERTVRRWLTLALLLLLSASSAAAQRKGAKNPLDKSFDALVDTLLAEWKVPGIGLAVVKGNEVILLKGYGYKDLEAKAPVTPQTKFAIGSVTKSFVVTGLAAQVKAKKAAWDEAIRTYLPDFRMYDDEATERMTIRDLVTHRSGLPRHDLMWYGSPLTREELYHRLQYLPPTKEFRSYWQYQNLMFMTAGYLSGKLHGTSWENTVKSLVFEPLGMTTADASVDDLQRSADYAFPYSAERDKPAKRMPFRNLDAVGPAGSINSSVEEMSYYLRMHMAGGSFNGKEVIAKGDAFQMQAPQMVMPSAPPSPFQDTELGHQQYGMGLFITTYRGHKLVHHGGNIDGFSAELSFLPDDSLGVMVLTNLNGTPVRDFLPRYVYDRLLGLDRIDWNGRFKERRERGYARQDSLQKVAAEKRKTGTQQSHALAAYAGSYEHPGYGKITIGTAGSALSFKFNSFEMPLKHFHYDVFETDPPEGNRLEAKVQFHMNPDGEIDALSLPIEQALPPTRFEKAREKK
ncbi:MAG: serine hydrolase [Gemmatimonadales bacterium]